MTEHSPENKIPVFFACDENYVPYAAATAYSIMEHTSSAIDFYVLDGGITEHSRQLLRETLSDFPNASIEFISVDVEKHFADFPVISHFSLNTYSRILIPWLKPELNKAIYTDVDQIWLQDIKQYMDVDLQGYGIAAVVTDINNHIESSPAELARLRRLGIPEEHTYAQVANLVIDCQYWRDNKLDKQFAELTIGNVKELMYPDMEVINIMFAPNKYCKLPYRFAVSTNVMHLYEMDKDLSPMPADPILYHYASSCKPWLDKEVRHSNYFWDVAQKIPFYNTIRSNYLRHQLKPHVINTSGVKYYKFLGFCYLKKDKINGKITLLGLTIDKSYRRSRAQ